MSQIVKPTRLNICYVTSKKTEQQSKRLSQSLLLNLPYSLPDHASEFGAAIDLSKFEYFPAGQWYSRLSLTKKTI